MKKTILIKSETQTSSDLASNGSRRCQLRNEIVLPIIIITYINVLYSVSCVYAKLCIVLCILSLLYLW